MGYPGCPVLSPAPYISLSPGVAKGASSLGSCQEHLEFSRTGSVSIFLRVTALDNAFLLVLELLGSRHGIGCAIARVTPASRVNGRRRARTIRAVHRGVFFSVVGSTEYSCRILKIKMTWSGIRGRPAEELPRARCMSEL